MKAVFKVALIFSFSFALMALLDEFENELDFSNAVFYNFSLRHSVASMFT